MNIFNVKSYLIILLILVITTLYGQNTKTDVSGFGYVSLSFSKIKNKQMILDGGGGAVLLNQKYYFGIYGVGILNGEIKEFTIDNELVPHKLEFGHGGLYFGYIHNCRKKLHLAFSSKIGLGDISYKKPYIDNNNKFNGADLRYHESIIAFYPQAEVELSISFWFKINVGIGYQMIRWLGAEKNKGVYNINNFNTPMLSITFAFGNFDKI